MSFGSNLAGKTQRARLLFSRPYHNRKLLGLGSSRVITTHVLYFVLISILRGQLRTPPSGDNLGVLDYHLK